MKKIILNMYNSMEKVFPKTAPGEEYLLSEISALGGETVSVQAVYFFDADCRETRTETAEFIVESPLTEYMTKRMLGYVPALTPTIGYFDDVISSEPGLFPDILLDMPNKQISLVPGQYRSVWLDFELPKDCLGGEYEVICRIKQADGMQAEATVRIKVVPASLPEQALIHTEWFHSDCLADYYQTDVFSEKWWSIVESFVETAVRRGVNMILTPIFTPPLDTEVGGERTTVQLVDVCLTAGKYTFGFERLDRWVRLCLKKGVKYIEISHLYSQWGAKFAPKVMAAVDGVNMKLFGWHVPANSPEYAGFLAELLPELTQRLRELGVAENTFFHISDEPHGEEDIESYSIAMKQIAPYIEGFRVIDALSDYTYYKMGVVKKPIVASDRIEAFLENEVPGLWTYYCCSQKLKVSNRFICQTSARNRIIGVMLYKFDIEGFLHWGYNFYNSRLSLKHINPFLVTDADCGFPAGDAFLVYPGRDGKPLESIRLMVFAEALQDVRALRLLESLTGRENVLRLIDEQSGGRLTFSDYPHEAGFIIKLRETVNAEIARLCSI